MSKDDPRKHRREPGHVRAWQVDEEKPEHWQRTRLGVSERTVRPEGYLFDERTPGQPTDGRYPQDLGNPGKRI